MKILKEDIDKKIIIDATQQFKNDAGWQESFSEYEKQVLKDVVNIPENYDTVRYIHKPYEYNGYSQSDIWYYFNFIDVNNEYTLGFNYENVGLTNANNAVLSNQSIYSFFRLEFYKTPNNELPTRANRKLAFTKNLNLALGEKIFYTPLNDLIRIPVFMGSNYKNMENMYIFWFYDNSVLQETVFSGDTFYMAAKYYNGVDGSISDFTNKPLDVNSEVNETNDMYYTVTMDKTDFSFQVSGLYGRYGTTDNPIIFYEKRQ